MAPGTEIELDQIDFLTAGTVGPKGKRTFHIQAGQDDRLVTLTLEKEQTRLLAEAITELLDDLKERHPDGSEPNVNLSMWDMNLRDPVDPLFRVAQIGLGFDDVRNMVVLVAQELIFGEEDDPALAPQPNIVRLWGTREQYRALSLHAARVVEKGRADPKQNGRIIYYWT
ncbi:MAG: DUF3090 family protein [Anaerolineales bacterium]